MNALLILGIFYYCFTGLMGIGFLANFDAKYSCDKSTLIQYVFAFLLGFITIPINLGTLLGDHLH